ncbi:hypothetical protein DACRYDRAFT_21776 [Dacryopinax primogenitus]|uniref:Uncharacterized protein n=1 Tax=Dacryopinax primogenitus (strain DJM 731) TaxID=1858805 RepID=M5FXS3_DACPD|nr:uncharacterized protein DACRYDRAFT_21776 [Dacryopinax primogenitus]EJU02836.1 hypothetical protein DACRYDRAFT_21776 [Dacryopinax primogenitus]
MRRRPVVPLQRVPCRPLDNALIPRARRRSTTFYPSETHETERRRPAWTFSVQDVEAVSWTQLNYQTSGETNRDLHSLLDGLFRRGQEMADLWMMAEKLESCTFHDIPVLDDPFSSLPRTPHSLHSLLLAMGGTWHTNPSVQLLDLVEGVHLLNLSLQWLFHLEDEQIQKGASDILHCEQDGNMKMQSYLRTDAILEDDGLLPPLEHGSMQLGHSDRRGHCAFEPRGLDMWALHDSMLLRPQDLKKHKDCGWSMCPGSRIDSLLAFMSLRSSNTTMALMNGHQAL